MAVVPSRVPGVSCEGSPGMPFRGLMVSWLGLELYRKPGSPHRADAHSLPSSPLHMGAQYCQPA